jgi:hypothetical protein
MRPLLRWLHEVAFVHLHVHSEYRMEVALPDPSPQSVFEPLVTLIEARCLAKLQAVPQKPRFVSKEKLADLYGVKERTIKTWRAKGLPGYAVGKEIMYDLEEVNRWIEAHA